MPRAKRTLRSLTAWDLARMSQADRDKAFEGVDDASRKILERFWPFRIMPGQVPPPGDWRVWLLMAGRGFGKTRSGAEWVRGIAEADGRARIALVGATMAEARSVMVEGDSGLLAIAPSARRPLWEPSQRRLRWRNGAVARLFAASEPEGLRGPQHSHAWCDEIAKWPYAIETWDNLAMGLRLGEQPRIVATTTPRPVPLVRMLVARGDVMMTGGRTEDIRLGAAAGRARRLHLFLV